MTFTSVKEDGAVSISYGEFSTSVTVDVTLSSSWNGTKNGKATTTDTNGNLTTWWYTFAGDSDISVVKNSKLVVAMNISSHNGYPYNVAPCIIARDTNKTEYVVVRPDNYGWGTYYPSLALNNNFAWIKAADSRWLMDGNSGGDSANGWFEGSNLVISVTNNGSNSDLSYVFTKANSSTRYFMTYTGLTGGTSTTDLNINLCFDGCVATIGE